MILISDGEETGPLLAENLSNEPRGLGPHDLLDKELWLQIGGTEHATGVVVREQGGKPRLRKIQKERQPK